MISPRNTSISGITLASVWPSNWLQDSAFIRSAMQRLRVVATRRSGRKVECPIAASDFSHWLSGMDFEVKANEVELGVWHIAKLVAAVEDFRAALNSRLMEWVGML